MLFPAAFLLLLWNEARPVRWARSLDEAASIVVSTSADKVDSANEGNLVHMTGQATTTDTLSDPIFGVSARAIKLERKVEMYQWREESSGEGGGVRYSKEWSPDFIPSSVFKERGGHENARVMPASTCSWTARTVTLGAFTLSQAQVRMLDKAEVFSVYDQITALPPVMKPPVKLRDGGYYLGADPTSPAIGDVKVEFRAVRPATVSIVGRQIGSTFEPYRAKTGESILLVAYGTVSADSMFRAAQQPGVILTWILRGVGLVMMALGLTMLLDPPRGIVVDFGPTLGTLGNTMQGVLTLASTDLGQANWWRAENLRPAENVGVGILAALLAACLSLVTIAVRWFGCRPLQAFILLLLAQGGILGLVHLTMRRKKERAETPTATS